MRTKDRIDSTQFQNSATLVSKLNNFNNYEIFSKLKMI